MAEESDKKSTSFPFFKLISLISVIYLILIALEINLPYLDLIPINTALLVIAGVLFFNILTGGGDGHIRNFKRNLAKELKK